MREEHAGWDRMDEEDGVVSSPCLPRQAWFGRWMGLVGLSLSRRWTVA